jgi:lipoprotein NlpI
MRKIALAMLLGCVSAHAASYNDLNVAIYYLVDGDDDKALAWFDKALAPGDLNPDLTRVAHLDRGRIYLEKRQDAEAIADFTAVLAIKPGDAAVLRDRAAAYAGAGKLESAADDLDLVLAKFPSDKALAFHAGLINWQVGRYERAAQNFSGQNAGDVVGWLWLQLANVRSGKTTTPFQGVITDREAWPNPLIALYSGEKHEDEILKVARESKAAASETCDAEFFAAEWRIAHGDGNGARPLLQDVTRNCVGDRSQAAIAAFELAKLTPRGGK